MQMSGSIGARALASALIAACLALPAGAQNRPEDRTGFAGRVEVEMEPVERYSYPGRPVEMRVRLRNPTGKFMDITPELLSPDRLKVLGADEQPLAAAPDAAVAVTPDGPPPSEILPRRSVERIVRLSDRYEGLMKLGRHTVVWEHPGEKARSAIVQVIREYDPGREYLAEVFTSMGRFTIEFFPSVAPRNVKNFIDLAHSGFYDKRPFHMVIPGILIQTGDPKGDGNGYPGYRVPAEFNRIRHLKGTVSMWHHASTVDAGSQFFVCLADQPQFDGRYTVIGQVRDGLDVVEKIGQVPTTEDKGRVPFRPLEAVNLERIRIKRR
jgi:cyclophilin family peptidyl-prolyl cis-trans isomerase